MKQIEVVIKVDGEGNPAKPELPQVEHCSDIPGSASRIHDIIANASYLPFFMLTLPSSEGLNPTDPDPADDEWFSTDAQPEKPTPSIEWGTDVKWGSDWDFEWASSIDAKIATEKWVPTAAYLQALEEARDSAYQGELPEVVEQPDFHPASKPKTLIVGYVGGLSLVPPCHDPDS